MSFPIGGAYASTLTLDYTAEFYTTPTNPDVLLIADDGHDHSLPTVVSQAPEPSTAMLLLIPAAALVVRRRCRFGVQPAADGRFAFRTLFV